MVYFNYDFYRTIKRDELGEGLDHDAKREIKHHDFWIYDIQEYKGTIENKEPKKNFFS